MGTYKHASPQQIEAIEHLAANGSREKGIHLACGISIHTWLRWKAEDPRVLAALERGNEKFHDGLLADLKKMGKKGNVVAPLFLLKTRFGYRDNDPPPDLRPQITINLPGAMALADVAKTGGVVVDVTPQRDALPAPVTQEADRG